MKSVIIGSIAILGLLVPAVSWGDPSLSTKLVERKLKENFSHAQKLKLTGMQQNYWGIYRSYRVTFNVESSGSKYKIGCDLIDRHPQDLTLNQCQTFNVEGAKLSNTEAHALGFLAENENKSLGVEYAKTTPKSSVQRFPASAPGAAN
jgi:hypothetical protein